MDLDTRMFLQINTQKWHVLQKQLARKLLQWCHRNPHLSLSHSCLFISFQRKPSSNTSTTDPTAPFINLHRNWASPAHKQHKAQTHPLDTPCFQQEMNLNHQWTNWDTAMKSTDASFLIFSCFKSHFLTCKVIHNQTVLGPALIVHSAWTGFPSIISWFSSKISIFEVRCFRKIHNLDLSKEYSVGGWREGKHIYCHPNCFNNFFS